MALLCAMLTQVASALQASACAQQLCSVQVSHAVSLGEELHVAPPPLLLPLELLHCDSQLFVAHVASALKAWSCARHVVQSPAVAHPSSHVTQLESLLQAVACAQHWAARHVAHAVVPVMTGHEAFDPLLEPEQLPDDIEPPPMPPPMPPPPEPQLLLLLLEEHPKAASVATSVHAPKRQMTRFIGKILQAGAQTQRGQPRAGITRLHPSQWRPRFPLRSRGARIPCARIGLRSSQEPGTMRAVLQTSLPILLLAAATTAGVAKADPNNPTDSDKAAARPFAIEGLRLVQAGNCKDAVEQLGKAEALVHAPTTAVPLAQCEIQLGKIIAGTELLNRVLNESLPPNAPPSFADAKKQARGILDAAQPKIAKLRIHVEIPAGVQPNPDVTVDGEAVPRVLLDADRPTDPGSHKIVARQAGVGSAEAEVSLTEGQTLPVVLHLAAGGGGGTMTAGVPPDPYGQAPAATPASPPAPSSTDSGAPWMAFEFGLRLAFGLPFGSAEGGNGNDLDHFASNMFVPLWLDAGLRFMSHYYVGAYFSFGLPSLSNQVASGQCNQAGFGCSSNDTRLGINAIYHVLPDGIIDPWFGLGFGYEWFSFTETATAAAAGAASAVTQSSGIAGWEYLDLQGGVDFRLLNGALGVGPFIMLAFDQYNHASTPSDSTGGTTGSSIQNQALHEWFLMGVRGDYDVKF